MPNTISAQPATSNVPLETNNIDQVSRGSGRGKAVDGPVPPPRDPATVASKAPPLRAPTVVLDIASLASSIGLAFDEMKMAQGVTVDGQIDTYRTQREGSISRALERAAEAAKKAEEATAAMGENKVAAWFRTIFGVIGAALGVVAAAMATGLTVGGFAIGMVGAVLGLTLALTELGNQIAKEVGATVTAPDGSEKALDISIGGMVSAIVEAQIEGGSLSFENETAKQEYVNKWSIAANILVISAIMACSIPSIAAAFGRVADKGAEFTSKLAKLAEVLEGPDMVMRSLEMIAQVGDAASSITEGSISIKAAIINRDSERAKADQNFYNEISRIMTGHIESQLSTYKNLATAQSNAWSEVYKLFSASANTDITIARNMAAAA